MAHEKGSTGDILNSSPTMAGGAINVDGHRIGGSRSP
jgi:hypothetical protein